MEPRNFGVFLWADGLVRTRFAPVEAIDFDVDEENYARWIAYWERFTKSGRIQIRNRRAVLVKSAKFLKELQLTQKGNYLLETGGEIVDAIRDIDSAADFLFERLVASSQVSEVPRAENVKQRCDRALRLVGVMDRDDYSSGLEVEVDFGDVKSPIRFDHGLGSSLDPRVLFNCVNIRAEQSVTSTAGKFAFVEQAGKVKRERRISLYDGGERNENAKPETIKFLNHWSLPVNVASPRELKQLSSRLAVG